MFANDVDLAIAHSRHHFILGAGLQALENAGGSGEDVGQGSGLGSGHDLGLWLWYRIACKLNRILPGLCDLRINHIKDDLIVGDKIMHIAVGRYIKS